MPKFDVTAYAVVLVKIENIEASSHQDAMVKAESAAEYADIFDRNLSPVDKINPNGATRVAYTQFGEEFAGYLVDEHGDPEYAKSVSYGADYKPTTGAQHKITGQEPIPPTTPGASWDIENLAEQMYLHDDPAGHWYLEVEEEKEAYRAYARIALQQPTSSTVTSKS